MDAEKQQADTGEHQAYATRSGLALQGKEDAKGDDGHGQRGDVHLQPQTGH